MNSLNLKRTILIAPILLFGLCLLQAQLSKINGISFVGPPKAIKSEQLKPLVKTNANWACVMPFAYMRELHTPELEHEIRGQWWGESPEGASKTIELMHQQGLKVMLKPQIWVWKGEFTGLISMKSEADWQKFEKDYKDFILNYARLAQQNQAELFCIGTELEVFVKQRPQFWLKLVKAVRKIYKGQLTYAENWDCFDKVPFWSVLDYIGIDAYFPLSDAKIPLEEQLTQGWERHKKQIKAVYNHIGCPVLFTEFGYRSIDYTAKEPWNYNTLGRVNLTNQKTALHCIFKVFWSEPWFAGGFLWKWFENHARTGGAADNRFTPQNKPAEGLIREFYGTYKNLE